MSSQRVLVVDDDVPYAMWIADELSDEGATVVGPAANLATAMRIAKVDLQGAILDVQLGDDFVWPLAIELLGRRVPFIFLSSYRGPLPPEFASVPLISKLSSPTRFLSSLFPIAGAGLGAYPAERGFTSRPAA